MAKKKNSVETLDYDLDPIIEVNTANTEATYYSDLSGQVKVIGYDDEQLLFKDDGKLKHHIKYLEKASAKLTKAYKANLKILIEATILLKKEQALLERKKKK